MEILPVWTPSHQFPTGVIYPIKRRIQLLNWGQESVSRYIIEDDYDSEFKFSGKPIPALQGLDRGEKVIYIGSFSKSISPSLRISYMVLSDHLLKLYLEKLSFYICPVPIIQQKVLRAFIEGGYFEKHLNRMRNVYKKKRALFLSEIKSKLEPVEVLGANAGLHLLLKINNGMSEEALVERAKDKGIQVYGLSNYCLRKKEIAVPQVVLGYGSMTEEKIVEATKLLKEGWFS